MILLESLFVGLYSLSMYTIFSNYNSFIIGFLKHFISGIIGLQKYYCSRYIQCDNFILGNLILKSIGEGIMYFILYNLLHGMCNEFVSFFIIGVFLHLLFEVLGIHSYFCKSSCEI